MGKMKPEKKIEMMESCLAPMNKEEREKMFSFCHAMLGETEEKFIKK